MKWQTAISDISGGKEIIRGYNLSDLIAKKTFAEVIYLILRGEIPSKKQTRMLEAILVACIDHGVGVSSALAARLTASSGNTLQSALASGILTFGKLHGGAAYDASIFFKEHNGATDIHGLVAGLKEKKIRIPGYGHKVLSVDPRTEVLFSIAREQGVYGSHCAFAREVEKALAGLSSKKLPLNIDGAVAAILLDMGFDALQAQGIFLIGRVPGLVSHIHEEVTSGLGLRRLAEDEAEYTGEKEKEL